MAPRSYRNFDLVIEREGDEFDVHVVDSPAGEAHGTFSMPFGEHELENFVLKMGARRGVRRAGSAPRTAAQDFGQTLYGAVFTPDVEYALRQSLQDCQGRGEGLRLRLRLHNAPELMDLPWEYLHSTALGRPLALSVDTPLVRYMDMGQAVEALEVTPPLRILVVIASPTDIEELDTERELANLREATAELVRDGRIEVHALASPTVQDLQHQLRKEAFHILHFMGHGIFDESTGTGMLAFEDDQRRARPVAGSDLGMMLHDHRGLQMVVLNACEGARTSVQDPLGGVAQSLARQGIPAVVAMQFEISDAAAKRFSRELYLAIADGYPVDAAVSEARKALYLQDRATEWGTPVLHLRAADGHIFDLKAAPRPAEVPTLMEEVEARADQDALGEISAIGILQRILAIDPDNEAAADQLEHLQASARRDRFEDVQASSDVGTGAGIADRAGDAARGGDEAGTGAAAATAAAAATTSTPPSTVPTGMDSVAADPVVDTPPDPAPDPAPASP
ncbi:MAG TPA: CHAT domain-containing protein, partial [Nitriliruptoraceae bacterium]|nr:CHAT domain-containing protein [Nitriliruptoraceae bacterium]